MMPVVRICTYMCIQGVKDRHAPRVLICGNAFHMIHIIHDNVGMAMRWLPLGLGLHKPSRLSCCVCV